MTDQPPGTPGPSGTTEVPWYERTVAPAVPAAAPVEPPSRAWTAQLPAQPAQHQPGQHQPGQHLPGHHAARQKGGAAPWVPAPRAPEPPRSFAPQPPGPSGPWHTGHPVPVPPPGGPRRRRTGGLVWAALGALVASALVAGGIVWGPQLWEARTESEPAAASSAGASPSADAEEDTGTAFPDSEVVPELPTLDEGTGPSAEDEPTPVDPEPEPELEPTTPGGDLGLAVPMRAPACDGTWAVFVGAATDAARYAADVQTLLDAHPGTEYTLTQGSCSSMRQQLPDGTLIYAVWAGPYPDQASACAARTNFGDTAYVKRMDDATPADQLWQC